MPKGRIMRSYVTAAFAGCTICTSAFAGGLERTDQSVGVLFEEGSHLELGLTFAFPDVSGVGSTLSPTPGAESGDIADEYTQARLAYKADINDRLSYAFIYDQPYGADVTYEKSRYFASNSSAFVDTNALTGILQYNLSSSDDGGGFSVFGGLRAQRMGAGADIPFLGKYVITTDDDWGYGYLAGVAYEKPEIALRVSLTYTSEIEHKLPSEERLGMATGSSDTEITTPESWYLEFQSGVAPKTLVFGSVRYVPWSDFEIAPKLYTRVTGAPLAFFEDNRTTYRLGVGRQFTNDLSGFVVLGYEAETGSPTTNFTPVDGFISYTVGGTYNFSDRGKIRLGIRYADVGDADTVLQGRSPAGIFENNDAWGVGLTVSFNLD